MKSIPFDLLEKIKQSVDPSFNDDRCQINISKDYANDQLNISCKIQILNLKVLEEPNANSSRQRSADSVMSLMRPANFGGEKAVN